MATVRKCFKNLSPWMQCSPESRKFCGQHVLTQRGTEQIPPKLEVTHASKLPGPLRLPLIDNMLYMMLHKEFQKNRLFKMFEVMEKDFGPMYRFHLHGFTPIVVFSRPEDIQAMYTMTSSNPARQGFASMKKIRDNTEGDYFNKKAGILIENDAEWWRVRSKVQGPMLKLENVRTYLPAMDEVSTDFVNSISDKLDNNNETPEDFITELYKWALESVGAVSLNTRLGCLDRNLPEDSEPVKLIAAVNCTMENMYKTEMFPTWKLYKSKAYRELESAQEYALKMTKRHVMLAEKALSKSTEEPSKPSMLEAFLNSDSLYRADIVTMIMDMLVAGVDTTSHTVAFALYLLSKNPECQSRLQDEIDEVLGHGKSSITEIDLVKLRYLKACVKETLRLYPIVNEVFRRFNEDVVINNVHIPKGWHGMFSNMLLGRNEKLFKRASDFVPERWLKERPLGTSHPYASLPFSHGKRNCIGRRIAEQEIFVLLTRIFQQYDVGYHYGTLECKQHLVLVPANPLKFKFTQRK